MGKITGFMDFEREAPHKRKVEERVRDFKEIEETLSNEKAQKQAARCMNCGVPFCHHGCPLGNIIPEFNDAVYEQNWEYAYEILISTNNFPEFTGRICPAPCEASCVLYINKPAVTIEAIERFIIETAFAKGYIKPNFIQARTGKKVAVIGSGPAGLAAAAQLNKAGHWVRVFERADQIGGLLRYGIPDFKLEKNILDRRIELMEEEGIIFQTNANVGVNIRTKSLLDEYDAILLCGGATIPRNLPIPGRELKGVHFAMEFLSQQNKRIAHLEINYDHEGLSYQNGDIWASGKNVVVIGGGDTGSDCVGTSIRQKANSITQLELLPQPPNDKNETTPWPNWPMILRSSTSHEEGCERKWAIQTKAFIGDEKGNLKALQIVEVEMIQENGKVGFKEKVGTEREIPCELALLAMGFVHPQKEGLLQELELELDEKGNVKTDHYQTNHPKVFAAGDMRRGQ